MKMTKKLGKLKVLMAMLVVGCMGLTGCGSSTAPAATDTSAAEGETEAGGESKLLKAIKDKGYITIGSSNDAPFFYENIETGELEGIDVEILKEMCSRLGIPDIQMKVVDFSNLLVELNNNSIDMVADAMYIKDERLQTALFTDVWYTEGEAIVTKKDSSFTTRESLKDAVVGAQPGTAFYETAQAWKDAGTIKELTAFENQATLMTAVNTGKVDAVVTDGIVSAYTLAQDSSLDLKLMAPYEAEAIGRIGAAVRFADQDFLNEVNETLNAMKEDGTLLNILKEFGLTEDYFVSVEDGKIQNVK